MRHGRHARGLLGSRGVDIDAGVPLALVTSAPIELMRVRMEEAGVPETDPHVPRIADFTTH